MSAYGSAQYWNDRYTKDPEPFDWYQRYAGLKELFAQYLRKNDTLLVPGCGNSRLTEDMYEDGYGSLTNLDFSPPVVEAMSNKYKDKKGMAWHVMDVLSLTFADSTFDGIIDKGTMDSVLCADNSTANVSKYLQEVARTLKPTGVFIAISYGTPENRLQFLEKDEYKWKVTVHTIPKPTISGAPPPDPTDPATSHYIYIAKKEK